MIVTVLTFDATCFQAVGVSIVFDGSLGLFGISEKGVTLGADVLQDEVQVLPADASGLYELLLRHAAQLQPADVEVAEGDAVGVQLVLIAAELEPFPHVALRPVLRVDGGPVRVAGCLMFKGRVILFTAEQIGPRHEGVAEGRVGQEGAVCHRVQHHYQVEDSDELPCTHGTGLLQVPLRVKQ